jgi:hypothetical protein
MQDRDKTIVFPRHRFEPLQPRKFLLKGLFVPKSFSIDDLNRPVSTYNIASQPNLAIAAPANTVQ